MLTYLKILIWRKGVHRLINLFVNEKEKKETKSARTMGKVERGGFFIYSSNPAIRQ